MQNYGHQNHSLAHPLEANFFEGLAILGYQNNNLDFSCKKDISNYAPDALILIDFPCSICAWP